MSELQTFTREADWDKDLKQVQFDEFYDLGRKAGRTAEVAGQIALAMVDPSYLESLDKGQLAEQLRD